MTDKKETKWVDKDQVRRLPYAYDRIEGTFKATPNEAKVAKVEEAFDAIETGYHSYREVAEWLSKSTGDPISHVGLRKLFNLHRPDSPLLKKRQQQKRRQKQEALTTKADHLVARRKRKMAAEKTAISAAQKRIKKLKADIEELKIEKVTTKDDVKLAKDARYRELDYSQLEKDGVSREKAEEADNIIFKPNPGPQTEFLAAEEQEVLYGGAAGGGKSYALLADPMRYFNNPHFVGLILRRTNDELRELTMKAQMLYKQVFGDGAKWSEQKKEFRFPSGARLWFTYLEQDKDVLRYQGQAFSYIAFDELTQYPTPFPWEYLRTRLRTTDPNLPVFMRATTNPGGPGHGWVKRMFIDPAPYGEDFWAQDVETGEILRWPDNHEDETKRGQPLFKRRFIPAKLSDNPYLYEDGNYEMNLLSQSEDQRRRLLEGDWSVADGAAFGEFRMNIHTCEPFDIPPTWRRFRSCDYGYASHSAVHWYAIDPEYDTLYVYRELYVTKHTGKDLARKILDIEKNDKVMYGVLDSSVWHTKGWSGPSIAEEMIAEGCRWRESDRKAGAREAGKNRLHELLKVRSFRNGEVELPGIIFFRNCRQIISDLPVIPVHPDGKDDIDDRYTSDHAYDSIRYGIMTRPRSTMGEEWYTQAPTMRYQAIDNTFGY